MTDFPPGAPCWAQLSASDPEAAKRFYGQLFDWTAAAPDPQYGGYTVLSLDGAPAAAVAPLMNPQQPVMWLLSFATNDTDATCEAAKKAGAQVWMEPMDVGELGRWALLSDPTGAPLSVWQAKQFAGFGVLDEPNAFGWIDLATRDTTAALAFYQGVFGWEVTPHEQYPMVGLAGKMFGGVMDMGDRFPKEVPAHWTPFFRVRDVDAVAGTASKLGADVLHGPTDVEMENGPRIAVIRDPQGATFGVFAPRTG
ncbi:VOC family protein [Kitasatospora sp. RB6PN24]|uniref:VOC family protein n=1 Tax=Kitasatospora humi TaxID=2893891 RepID=UPI001E3B6801|nr:VOC family protein [Kitasatospora humi]MCC9307617.1 VOC family protein [Kitasatospora humi]